MLEYNINVVRSARKSISIIVAADNSITVRCPKNMSDGKVNEFITQKRAWIEKIVSANSKKQNENAAILTYNEVYISGVRLPLIIGDKNKITQNAVYVKNVKRIKHLLVKYFSKEFLSCVERISAQVKLFTNSVSIKSYKSRWGCCDRNKNVKFNSLIFMLPPDIQNYIIIHELCHTVHFNHSAEFWRLVSQFVPNYKKIRSELKKFDYLTRIY
ncbi:MAG: M48 family metallopeptidase [Clostridia bacterium]|nr:M48 family metallopeptidase [Clostridia bacterium]